MCFSFDNLGGSNINVDRTIPEALALKRAGVHITITAVGDDMNPRELTAIASYPFEANIFWTPSQSGLSALIDDVSNSFCNGKNIIKYSCLSTGSCVMWAYIFCQISQNWGPPDIIILPRCKTKNRANWVLQIYHYDAHGIKTV